MARSHVPTEDFSEEECWNWDQMSWGQPHGDLEQGSAAKGVKCQVLGWNECDTRGWMKVCGPLHNTSIRCLMCPALQGPKQGGSWRPAGVVHQLGGQSGEVRGRVPTVYLPSVPQWFLSISCRPWGHRQRWADSERLPDTRSACLPSRTVPFFPLGGHVG